MNPDRRGKQEVNVTHTHASFHTAITVLHAPRASGLWVMEQSGLASQWSALFSVCVCVCLLVHFTQLNKVMQHSINLTKSLRIRNFTWALIRQTRNKHDVSRLADGPCFIRLPLLNFTQKPQSALLVDMLLWRLITTISAGLNDACVAASHMLLHTHAYVPETVCLRTAHWKMCLKDTIFKLKF